MNEQSRITFRYIDTNGDTIEDQIGLRGNWSLIPSGAVAVRVAGDWPPISPVAPMVPPEVQA